MKNLKAVKEQCSSKMFCRKSRLTIQEIVYNLYVPCKLNHRNYCIWRYGLSMKMSSAGSMKFLTKVSVIYSLEKGFEEVTQSQTGRKGNAQVVKNIYWPLLWTLNFPVRSRLKRCLRMLSLPVYSFFLYSFILKHFWFRFFFFYIKHLHVKHKNTVTRYISNWYRS